MSEKSGFFNALLIDGEYDRRYNANDYCDNLAVVISNGVLRSPIDDLKVTAQGMFPTVKEGRAWINGHYYYNNTPITFAEVVAPTGGSRWDRVVLRFDNNINSRKISLEYIQGVASNSPVKPAPIRTEKVFDLVIADVYVQAGATTLDITDTRADNEVCGWVYSTSGDNSFITSLDNSFYEWFSETKDTLSSVTLFKRYKWETVVETATNIIQFNIPQYDEETCFFEVYVNGLLEDSYTAAGNILTFEQELIAGTEITVNCYKSIDGTGIESVADEITELQNKVATLDGVSNFTYKCTGLNDNISISQIANAFSVGSYVEADCTPSAVAFLEALGGNTFLSNLYPSAQITIDVVGRMGISTAYAGEGTATSPYRWIDLSSITAVTDRKIVFDFAKCEMIFLQAPERADNIIFAGNQVNFRNANVRVYTGDLSSVKMIEGSYGRGKVNVENSYFEVSAVGKVIIAEHGNFTNCDCHITSMDAAYCFKPKSNSFIRLIGGTYLAYGLTETGIGSAIIHTSASEADAVLIAQNIHCPMVTKTNYTQQYLSVANAGNIYIDVVVSRLPSSGSYNTIVGQIQKNKA